MARAAKPIPEGLGGAIPYLACKGAGRAIEFYKKAFSAVEVMRIGEPDMIGHAEMKIGDAVFMLADEFPQLGFVGPEALGGSPVIIHVYVADVDAFVRRAVEAGATVKRPIKDEFYGDRACQLQDPFGHTWGIATRLEDLTPAEIQERARKQFGGA